MINLDKIISKIEKFAPAELAQDWDNSGWQLYLDNSNITKIMLALSPTLDVVEKALEQGCELLITHHPLIFSKINNLSTANHNDLALIKAVQNNLQIYCAHTNLDIAKGGVADVLAEKLELINVSVLEKTDKQNGIGRKGELQTEEDLCAVIDRVKKLLNIDKIKLINPSNIQKIKKIALLPGSGGSFVSELKDVDLYISGDVKYHDALAVKGFAVVDAGHFATERIVLPKIEELLKEFDVEIFIADEQLPWVFV